MIKVKFTTPTNARHVIADFSIRQPLDEDLLQSTFHTSISSKDLNKKNSIFDLFLD